MKACFLVVLYSALTLAQTFQGTLRGRVLDPTGNATVGTKVTITDEGTQVSRTTVTNDQGEYVFSAVTPALYTLTAEAPGFKKSERRGIDIAAQAAVAIDVTLEIGAVTESVNVTAETPALQTADASTGQVIDAQKLTDLPILGRNPFFMAKLAENVVLTGNVKFARMQDQNGNAQTSIAGGPIRTNNYLVDGISVTDVTNRATILPSPEALQEMKLQASTYDAEVGRTGGGTFNTVLKSGTNDLHGSAVGHLRTTALDANNFFSNRAGQPIAQQPFKDWAGSLGGPIRIPKIYDGRNRTFFFITTESYRQADALTSNLSVPTAFERIGNFTQSFTKAGAEQIIYDPRSTNLTTGARTPFAGNIIPADHLSPQGLALASYYPLPNQPTPYYAAPNYTYTGPYPNRGDQSTWKADHQFFRWFQAAASYIHQKTYETDDPVGTFPNFLAGPTQTRLYRRNDATQANATLTPQPTMVIAIRWGFNRFYSTSPPWSSGFNLATLGMNSLVPITPNPAFPVVTLGAAVNGCGAGSGGDFAFYGGGCTGQDVWYSRSFSVSASKFLGRHSLKAGFDFRTLHDAGTPVSGPTSLGFTDVFTRATPQATTAGTGSSLATMLLGYPTSGQMTLTSGFDQFIRYYGGFVQDDFRVTAKLTLNIGMRFEYESGVQEEHNKLVTVFNPTAPNPLQVPNFPVSGVIGYAGVNGDPTQSGNPLSVKPGPRFGVAYSVDSKTVLRGGYGIFWAPAAFVLQPTLGYTQSTTIIASTNNNFTPAATLANPYPNGLVQPTGNTLGPLTGIGTALSLLDPKAQSGGYVQQYSFEVQRQTVNKFVITLGFLGSHSLHLIQTGQNVDQLNPSYFPLGSALNQSVPNPFYNNGGAGSLANPTVARSQLLLPFPQYTNVTMQNSGTASARYYSTYIRAERRFDHGWTLLASYTFSRSVDDLFGISLAGTNQIASPAGPQNAYNLTAEYGLSTQDVPNRFTTAITYELPFGKGKPLLHNSRILDLVAGGWVINAIALIQTGYPLVITQQNNNSSIGATYQRPNATGISPVTSGSIDQRINGWLNPAAFSQAPQYTFGNISRDINARGPGLYNWDISVFKTFSIRERLKAQFRAEALNATNTVYFGEPNTTFGNAAFGVITAQNNNPRMLQLGLRFTF